MPSPSPGPTWHPAEAITLTRDQRSAAYAAWAARERHAPQAEQERLDAACLALGVTPDGQWVQTPEP